MTLEEKLEYFSKQIKDKIDREYNEKIIKTQEENELRLSQKRDELRKRRELEIIEFTESNRIRVKKLLSLKKQDMSKQIYALKKEMFEQVFNELLNELSEFVNGDHYHRYLVDLFNHTVLDLPEGNYTIYALNRDSEIINKLIQENKKEGIDFCFSNSEENILGGMLFSNLEKGFMVDNSLKSKLYNLKKDIHVYFSKKLEVENE